LSRSWNVKTFESKLEQQDSSMSGTASVKSEFQKSEP